MRTVIIDDEPDAVDALELIIEEFLPNLKVVNTFTDSEKALKKIPIIQPDLVFLDINMPGLNGFQLLEKLGKTDFHIIFTTAYDEYAIKAFKFGVANYLLKPIDIDDLITSVERLSKPNVKEDHKLSIETITPLLSQNKGDKIAINSPDGVHYIIPSEIMYITSIETNVTIYTIDNKNITIRKALKEFEKSLPEQFVRIHNSYIVNVNFIKKLIKTEQWSVVMETGTILPIARRKRSDFMYVMNKIIGNSRE